jgi:hypothetical protein
VAELSGYQRQCDVQVSRGDYCNLVLGHRAPECDASNLPSPVEECYRCWAAPRYPLDGAVQRHAERHEMDTIQKRQADLRAKHSRGPVVLPDVITERLGEPEITHAPPTSTCAVCGGGMWYQDCPTGGWWSHNQHPADHHDAALEVDDA